MKYYLIAGEASGDLHASRLMRALAQEDAEAQFRCIGGDLMQAEGATLVKHYRELAYMGFVPVVMHLRTILSNMQRAKRDIAQWRPDVVVLVDYPGFNLSIAKFVHREAICPVYYYISPKIWAWKEYRIRSIKRDVDELFSILPFEVDFFQQKHHYPIHYVGNPTADEVSEYLAQATDRTPTDARPVIALLAGSRRQEIKDNLTATSSFWPAPRASTTTTTPASLQAARSGSSRIRPTTCCAGHMPPSSPAGRLRSRQLCSACRRWCATRRPCRA